MPREGSAADSPSTIKNQAVELYKDVEHEVKREVPIPLASSEGDLLVRKHINRVAITFFIMIALLVMAAIVGYAIYTHY
jgi:hypothetical protein